MSHEHSIGEPAELAALYAAGALSPEAGAAFEAHLDGGCILCAAAVRDLNNAVLALADAAEPVAPSPQTRDKLLQRVSDGEPAAAKPAPADPQVWKAWQSNAAAGLFTQRGDEAVWESVGIDGISIRRMFVDRERNQFTALVRMAPGTAYPRHLHNGPEECLVLQGDLRVGDTGIVLRQGDYQRAEPGSDHPIQSTENGCVLLIVSALDDEIY